MSIEALRQRADELRRIALPSVLRVWGARRDRDDPCKWHTTHGNLSVNGAKFINWHSGIGGGGAIDLVIDLENCHFKEALDWLQRHFPDGQPQEIEDEEYVVSRRLQVHCALVMPAPDPVQLTNVKTYLASKRSIDFTVINALIQSGSLYADKRANAVFVLLGKKARAVGAELRATRAATWRGIAPGSRKDLGYFSFGNDNAEEDPRPIILCESAIDAISCAIIHPSHRCLSTAGARPNPAWLGPLINEGKPIYCGYDTDDTGERMAQAMIALHPTVKRLRPARHDWNAVLKSLA